MDKRFFMQAMERLSIALPKFAPAMDNRETLAVWYADLKDIPAETFDEACATARRTLDGFPSIAWFLRTADNINLDASGVGEDTAERIEGAIKACGYTNPDGARSYIGELGWAIILDQGGWTSVCAVTYDELISMRRLWRDAARNRFIKLAASGANRGIGLPSAQNSVAALSDGPTLTLVADDDEPKSVAAKYLAAAADAFVEEAKPSRGPEAAKRFSNWREAIGVT